LKNLIPFCYSLCPPTPTPAQKLPKVP